MYVGRVESALGWSDLVAIRLLRRWVAARAELANPLPSLIALAHELGCPAETAVALGSLFQLTESCLGRPLEGECCSSRSVGADEKAMLLMIAAAPGPGLPAALREIPHGLPGALAWAASSVRRLLRPGTDPPLRALPDRCPFAAPEPAEDSSVAPLTGN